MKNNLSKKLAIITIALSSALVINNVQAASTLAGDLNIDDAYNAYISIDNSTQGTSISDNGNWQDVTSFSDISLAAGQDYFLHVFGINSGGGKTGFIGDFTITGADHSFTNDASFATTGDLWQVNATGWDNYGAITVRDTANIPGAADLTNIDTSAKWIWDSNDKIKGDEAYFTLEISAKNQVQVPEPSVILLLATGLLGFVGIRKKKV